MPTNNDEIERIKRIQEQQIRVRYDPNEKKAKFNQISAQRRQGTKVTGRSVLKDIPSKVWWALGGGLIGAVLAWVGLRLSIRANGGRLSAGRCRCVACEGR